MTGRMNVNSKSSGAGAGRGMRALLLCSGAMAAVAFTPAFPMHTAGMVRAVGNTRGELGRLGLAAGAMHGQRGEAMHVFPPAYLASSPRRGGLVLAAMTSVDGSTGGEEYNFKRQSGKGKKILVAGGAGYIGTHLCADLLMHDYEVCILDNFANSSPLAIERVVSCPAWTCPHEDGLMIPVPASLSPARRPSFRVTSFLSLPHTIPPPVAASKTISFSHHRARPLTLKTRVTREHRCLLLLTSLWFMTSAGNVDWEEGQGVRGRHARL